MTTKSTSLTQLFATERSRVVRLIGRMIGCRTTAEDLAQDTFLRLMNRTEEVRDASYLFRTAQNLAIDHLRAQRVRTAHAEAVAVDPEKGRAPENALEAREELRVLQTALAGLPERVQRVFLLNRLDGMSYGEIAVRLGVSVSTVEKDMIRALDACRRCLPGHQST